MSERTAIEVLAAQAKQLMLSSVFIMVDGSPEVADIWQVVRKVVGTIFDYDLATHTIMTTNLYDPASIPRDNAAWYRLLEMLGNNAGSNAHHWINDVFLGDENPHGSPYEYLIGLVRSLIASVLEAELRLDPRLHALDVDRGENSEEIEAAARASISELSGTRLVNDDM